MQKINLFILWICKILIMIMIPLMTVVVFAQVVMRYVFLSPFTWAEEMARYLLVWISCLGAAYGVKTNAHIGIVLLRDKFKGYSQLVVTVLIHFLLLGFFLVCFVKGLSLAIAQHSQISPGMQMPMIWAYISVPVAFGFMIMFSIELLIENVWKYFQAKRF